MDYGYNPCIIAIICGLWSKIRIIHICLPSRSLKTHVFLCETKDHLPRKVTPIFYFLMHVVLKFNWSSTIIPVSFSWFTLWSSVVFILYVWLFSPFIFMVMQMYIYKGETQVAIYCLHETCLRADYVMLNQYGACISFPPNFSTPTHYTPILHHYHPLPPTTTPHLSLAPKIKKVLPSRVKLSHAVSSVLSWCNM